MTPRERFVAAIHFRKPDILPWCEIFFDETVINWFKQGLPADKLIKIEWRILRDGIHLLNWPTLEGFDPYSYFGCINLTGCLIPVDIGPIPRFKLKMLSEDERYITFLTETGAVMKRIKKNRYVWYNMPMYVEFPVKDRKSWEEYKKRLDPKDPRRYPKDWYKDSYIDSFENYEHGPTLLAFNGFYGFGAQLMGIVPFIMMFYKDPELMHEMVEYWEYFVIESIRDAVETLREQIDLVYWWEDMAEKNGPCISPKIFKEFFLPHYKRVTNFLKKNGVSRIMMDSDGNLNPILDLISEAGITGLFPLEVNSGMDAIKIRRKYGNKFFLIGNLDKRKLIKGGIEMKKEIDSKLPILKELGGYVPSIDHLVPTEFDLKIFKEYAEYLKKLLPY
jgi:uroporphyrinogen decarboxylase